MSKAILITGGASSGKTKWAVSYFQACDYVIYLRTSDTADAEAMYRMEHSAKQNYVEWSIKTNITDNPASYLADGKFVVFDSLTEYTLNTMRRLCPDPSAMTEKLKKEIEKKITDDMSEMCEIISARDGNIIIITIETGFSLIPSDPEQAVFREILGTVNQSVAKMSDEVYLSASGVQLKIK